MRRLRVRLQPSVARSRRRGRDGEGFASAVLLEAMSRIAVDVGSTWLEPFRLRELR